MLRLGFTLLLYTGQRIGDVLGLRWDAYDGEYITLTQGKTGTPVSIFCHHDLRAALDEAKRAARGVYIVTLLNGRPTSYNNFRQLARKALVHIGREHLQIHDLRRTACTRLAEAGCTESQIASITGHSIERTRKILDTYIVRTKALTKGAILKLEGRSPTPSPTAVQRGR